MPNALAFWGKARTREYAENPYHPAAHHSLDRGCPCFNEAGALMAPEICAFRISVSVKRS